MRMDAATFDPAAFGGEVAAILTQQPRLTLTAGTHTARLGDWFRDARSPAGALAGLALYQGDWRRAHEIAQDDPSPEGTYWHGIVHRLEPDAWNAGYWFRRLGRHPVFPALSEQARAVWAEAPDPWDPERFVAFCEAARSGGDPATALSVQAIEWRLLFTYCARPA
jgi:hypothetical protein